MFHFRVRNGTGWGHQAMTTRLRSVAGALRMLLVLLALTACPGRHVVACGLCFLLFLRLAVFAALPALCFQQADIRVARGVCFFFYAFALTQGYQAFYQRLVTRGLIEVYRMLVALGSIHYCNYTCALSTWSSSTLLSGELILGGTWRLDAFSAYSFRT